MFALVAGVFAEAPSRRRGRAYLLGLLSQAERKNGWTIAELAGDWSPAGMQRLLNFYTWDEDAARDALRSYVARGLGDPGAVLAVDETGFLKKGKMSAGVARMYTGTAGRVENCQVGVFLAYVTPDGGRALIDRELYLPEKWTDDRDRCRAAGIGDEVAFATKPELARQMIERAVQAGVPFSWVAGDEVYGGNPKLRAWLEEQQIAHVMAVKCSEMITVPAGARRADELAALVPKAAWQRLSCADGSKGPRLYDWALIEAAGAGHHLLARRSLHPGEKGQLELAFFRCWSPRPVTLAELVAVAGARWGVEDCFAEAKNETGLDHYQVRKYQAWYRHATLSILAHAFLAVTAHAMRPAPPGPPPASQDDQGDPGKKGTVALWTEIHPAQDV
ncbi:MAG: IS701 family transposase [Actinomycetota bacterium]|nr:IS701 family transposase [Actinomycetota bacterium]